MLVGKITHNVGRFIQKCGDIVILAGQRYERAGAKPLVYYIRSVLRNGYLSAVERLFRRMRVTCPCCGWSGYSFRPFDMWRYYIPDSVCPHCGSHPRHRFLELYISRRCQDALEAGGHCLHVSPQREGRLRSKIKEIPGMKVFHTDVESFYLREIRDHCFLSDLTRMPAPSETFDIVFCIHVLEHIREDRKALAEIRRILRPGGTAFIMVPFGFESLKTTRELDEPDVFGHVWHYQPDGVRERLTDFEFSEVKAEDLLTPEEMRRYGVFHREDPAVKDSCREYMYHCVRPE